MAKRTPADQPADDFDDLLADDAPALPEVESNDDVDNFDDLIESDAADDTVLPDDAPLTPEQQRIKELEAALEALDEAEVELTPEQKRIRELEAMLEDKIAATAGPVVTEQPEGTGEKILFHFKKDGLLVLGNIWLRGQEIEIEVGSPAYQRTINKQTGESWLSILDNESAQYAKWGDHYVGSGPFIPRPDEKFEDEVAKEDRQRRRRPVVLAR